MTHYEVLGVSPDADPAAIRAAWLRLARAHHPDYHAGAGASARAVADRRMQRINEAWAVLRDERRRTDYDRSLGIDGHGFRPFDVDEAPAPTLPDEDVGPAPSLRRRALVLAPAGLLLLSAALFSVALLTAERGLLALAAATGAAAVAAFVALPVLAMAEAGRSDHAGERTRRRPRGRGRDG